MRGKSVLLGLGLWAVFTAPALTAEASGISLESSFREALMPPIHEQIWPRARVGFYPSSRTGLRELRFKRPPALGPLPRLF